MRELRAPTSSNIFSRLIFSGVKLPKKSVFFFCSSVRIIIVIVMMVYYWKFCFRPRLSNLPRFPAPREAGYFWNRWFCDKNPNWLSAICTTSRIRWMRARCPRSATHHVTPRRTVATIVDAPERKLFPVLSSRMSYGGILKLSRRLRWRSAGFDARARRRNIGFIYVMNFPRSTMQSPPSPPTLPLPLPYFRQNLCVVETFPERY